MDDMEKLGGNLIYMVNRLNDELALFSNVTFNSCIINVLIDKLIKIVRVIKLPRSNVILLGPDGTGKLDLILIA